MKTHGQTFDALLPLGNARLVAAHHVMTGYGFQLCNEGGRLGLTFVRTQRTLSIGTTGITFNRFSIHFQGFVR